MTQKDPAGETAESALESALAHKAEAELATHGGPRSAWIIVEEVLVGGLALIALLVCSYNVFIRYFLPEYSVEAAEEVQVYLVIWAVFLALGLVTVADRHVRADLFVAMFPPAVQRFVKIFSEILGLAFAILLLVTGIAITWQTYDFGDVSTTSLRFPLWIYGASLPVGALLMALAYLVRCVRLFKKEA